MRFLLPFLYFDWNKRIKMANILALDVLFGRCNVVRLQNYSREECIYRIKTTKFRICIFNKGKWILKIHFAKSKRISEFDKANGLTICNPTSAYLSEGKWVVQQMKLIKHFNDINGVSKSIDSNGIDVFLICL